MNPDEIRADFLFRYGTPRSEAVEAGRVRDFLLAMDEPDPLASGGPVPSLFLLTLARTRRPQPAKGTSVNAGDEFEFIATVFVGDRITIERRLCEIEKKKGRHGDMYLLRSEATYVNQRGKLVARAKSTSLRWE